MKKYLWLALSLLFFYSCQKSDNNFIIEGQIENPEENCTVTLFHVTPSQLIPVDSTVVKNGKFKLKGKADAQDFYMLKFSDKDYNIFLVLDSAEHVKLKADCQNLVASYSISGSEESKLIQLIEFELYKTQQKLDSITKAYSNLSPNDTAKAQELDSLYMQTVKHQKNFSKKFVSQHKNSLVALLALSQTYLDKFTVFNTEKDTIYYFMVDSALGKKFPDNLHVKKMHFFVKKIKLKQQTRYNRQSLITTGSKAPAFTSKTINGENFSSTKLDGPYIIFFWAAWSDKSIQTAQKLKTIATKEHIPVVAVSLDTDEHLWKNAVNSYGIKQFINVSELKQWDSQAVKLFNVKKIPYFIFVNSKGQIKYMGENLLDMKKTLNLK